jgi:hypothetical protein
MGSVAFWPSIIQKYKQFQQCAICILPLVQFPETDLMFLWLHFYIRSKSGFSFPWKHNYVIEYCLEPSTKCLDNNLQSVYQIIFPNRKREIFYIYFARYHGYRLIVFKDVRGATKNLTNLGL